MQNDIFCIHLFYIKKKVPFSTPATHIGIDVVSYNSNSALHNHVPPPERQQQQQQRPVALKATNSNPYLQDDTVLDKRETVSAPAVPKLIPSDLLVDVFADEDVENLPIGWRYAHGKRDETREFS